MSGGFKSVFVAYTSSSRAPVVPNEEVNKYMEQIAFTKPPTERWVIASDEPLSNYLRQLFSDAEQRVRSIARNAAGSELSSKIASLGRSHILYLDELDDGSFLKRCERHLFAKHSLVDISFRNLREFQPHVALQNAISEFERQHSTVGLVEWFKLATPEIITKVFESVDAVNQQNVFFFIRQKRTVDFLVEQLKAINMQQVIKNGLAKAPTAIHTVLSFFALEVALVYLQLGADASAQSSSRTILSYAVALEPTHPSITAGGTTYGLLLDLLRRQAPSTINLCNKDGIYPFQEALKARNYDAAKFLLQAGGSPYVLDPNKSEPIFIDALERLNPDTDAALLEGMVRIGHVNTQWLLECLPITSPRRAAVMRWSSVFQRWSTQLSTTTRRTGELPQLTYVRLLPHISTSGNDQDLQAALDSLTKVSYSFQDGTGRTLLQLLTRRSALDLLVKKNAPEVHECVNIPDVDGKTPLMNACANGIFDLALELLNQGANPKMITVLGRSAISYACGVYPTTFSTARYSPENHQLIVERLLTTAPALMSLRATAIVSRYAPSEDMRSNMRTSFGLAAEQNWDAAPASVAVAAKVPLTYAVEAGNYWAINAFVRAGAILDMPCDTRNYNLLHVAIEHGDLNLVLSLANAAPWMIIQSFFGCPEPYQHFHRLVVSEPKHALWRTYTKVLNALDQILNARLLSLCEESDARVAVDHQPAEIHYNARFRAAQFFQLNRLRIERRLSLSRGKTLRETRPTVSFALQLIPYPSPTTAFQRRLRDMLIDDLMKLLMACYDADMGQSNAFLLEMARCVLLLQPRQMGVSEKNTRLWFESQGNASIENCLREVDQHLQRFATSLSLSEKLDALRAWFHLLDVTIREFQPEGDPDLVQCLRAWTLCKANIPNLWSHYSLLCDLLFDQSVDPSDQAESEAAPLLFQLKGAIMTIECLFDQKRQALVSIEDGICGYMADFAPPSAFSLLAGLLGVFRNTPELLDKPFTLPCQPGDCKYIRWLADKYQITMEEIPVPSSSASTTPSQTPIGTTLMAVARFELRAPQTREVFQPSVCSEIFLLLSRLEQSSSERANE